MRQELEGDNGDLPEGHDALVSPLQNICRDPRFRGKGTAIHLPSQDIFSFPMRFVLREGDTIEETILREAREHLPFPSEEAIIDYPSIRKSSPSNGSEFHAIVIAARRSQIEKYIAVLKRAGMHTEVIDFNVCSLMRLHRYLHDSPQNPIMLCDIGWSQTLFAILTSDRIIAHRSVAWGLQAVSRKLVNNLEHLGVEEKANKLLKSYGLVYDAHKDAGRETDIKMDADSGKMLRAIYQIITPQVEELIYEFHKTIGYMRSEEKDAVLEAIYLYGLANTIRDFDQYLEARLSIPTRFVKPTEKMGLADKTLFSDPSSVASFASALGLALRKVTWL
jgi:type IV pilus assembly protein PilM